MKRTIFIKMMKHVFLLFFYFFASATSVYATHALGADLTYESLGDNKYLIRLKFFRDCKGVSAETSFDATIRSVSRTTTLSVTLQRVGGALDITATCPTSPTRCASNTSANPYGIEQYIYEATVSLPQQAKDYIISVSMCCRNNVITTLVNPNFHNLYIECLLNTLDGSANSSPQFANYPALLTCVNQLTKYNHGVTDAEGDILEFSLVAAKTSQSSQVPYIGTFGALKPIPTQNGMSINSVTGELTFTPNQLAVGVVCVKVQEYRMINGIKTLIGFVIRDLQVTVTDCSNGTGTVNKNPVLSGINGTASSLGATGEYDMTAGAWSEVCFNIAGYDAESSSLSLTWNQGIKGASFTPSSSGTSAAFCWNPTSKDVGFHFFTVTVKDENCPLQGANTYTYTINVEAGCPSLTEAPPNVLITNSTCGPSCVIQGGEVRAPAGKPCPDGSTLQYQVNGGEWSTILPVYEQTGSGQTIKTRCICEMIPSTISPESISITTIPGTVPTLTVPPNGSKTVACLADAVGHELPVVTDCSGNPITPNSPNIVDNPTALGCEGTRTYTYTYVCGSSLATATWSFVYTIERNPFTITTPNGTATVNNRAQAVAPSLPVVYSNCGEVLTPTDVSIINLPNPLTCEGTRTYTYTYLDCEGNTATWSFIYTIIDNTPPTISCPSSISVSNALGQCGANVIYSLPVGMDDCPDFTLVQTAGLTSGAMFPVGLTTNSFVVTAKNGQTASCSFTVTVNDTEPPTIVCPASMVVCEGSVVTYVPPVGLDNCLGVVTMQSEGLPSGSVFPVGTTRNIFKATATNAQTATCLFEVTVNPLPTATISGTATVCQNSPSPSITFTGANAIAPYTFTYKINDGAPQTVKTVSGNSVTVPVSTTTVGEFTYTLLSVSESSSTSCSQLQSGSVEIKVQSKPTITLSTLQQTLNEGNSQTFCDTDANPVNSLQFTVSGLCVVGSPVWRVQVGSGAWSDWSPNAPVAQPSNNQPHRYQAACDASCPVTYTSPIMVQINYRASTPQQVSLVADGVTVKEGESKEVCNIEGNAITFNATCTAGEVLLFSVDGGDYGSVVPTQLVDGQFHNYRVRCRKSDGTLSCIETESGVMRLKLTNGLEQVPVASLNVTSGCGTPVLFSGTASCGSLITVWYNASTNVALATLPSQTPTETTSYYVRCQAGGGCLSEKSNVVTYTVIPVGVAPVVTVSSEVVCVGTSVTVSANCPSGSQTFWNTGVTTPSFEVSFNNVTKQTYWAKCLFAGGCQSAESLKKDVYWNAFVVTLINIGESKSAVKTNDRTAWSSQFVTQDGGPELVQSTQLNPTLYYVENANKVAPRYWTMNVDACAFGTEGSLTFDLLATPETGVPQSFNTHENSAPYFMYANREGWTELYAQNHPAYGFYQDNGSGVNVYDAGFPKGLYKLSVRYWDQKGWGSIYPSTRKPQGNVLAYQEYWFRIQSKDGVGVGAVRLADSGQQALIVPPLGGRGLFVLPNPVTNILRLQVQDRKGQEVKTELMDAAGRKVLSRQFVPETNSHQEEFGVSELLMGIYFLKVESDTQQAVLKVVKTN